MKIMMLQSATDANKKYAKKNVWQNDEMKEAVGEQGEKESAYKRKKREKDIL